MDNNQNKKISKSFRFSDETEFYIKEIVKREARSQNAVVEFALKEKAEYYGITYVPPKTASTPKRSGAFDPTKPKGNPFAKG